MRQLTLCKKKSNWYGRSSTLAAQIKKLMASLPDVEECRKNASEKVTEAYRASETDQKILQQKKDDQINILKSLEE